MNAPPPPDPDSDAKNKENTAVSGNGSPSRTDYSHLLVGGNLFNSSGVVPPMARMDQEARAREGEDDYE